MPTYASRHSGALSSLSGPTAGAKTANSTRYSKGSLPASCLVGDHLKNTRSRLKEPASTYISSTQSRRNQSHSHGRNQSQSRRNQSHSCRTHTVAISRNQSQSRRNQSHSHGRNQSQSRRNQSQSVALTRSQSVAHSPDEDRRVLGVDGLHTGHRRRLASRHLHGRRPWEARGAHGLHID
jgi:hypothetical protein